MNGEIKKGEQEKSYLSNFELDIREGDREREVGYK